MARRKKTEETVQRVFFTGDLWFYRENIMEIYSRKFRSVEEMNDHLVDNWNSTVGDTDVVFILGNYIYDTTRFELINSRLRGIKVLLPTDTDKSVLTMSTDVIDDIIAVEEANRAELGEDCERMLYVEQVGLASSRTEYALMLKRIQSSPNEFVVLNSPIVELPPYGLVLSHYPLLDWQGKESGTMNIHAGPVPSANLRNERRFNVRTDLFGYCPVSYDSIMSIVKKSEQ